MTGACKGGGHGGAMPTPPTTMPERVRLGRTFCGHLAVADVGGVEYVRDDRHKAVTAERDALRAQVAEAVEALERITDCERYTRSGGPTQEDLASYEDGLNEAVRIAADALARHLQQAAGRDGAG